MTFNVSIQILIENKIKGVNLKNLNMNLNETDLKVKNKISELLNKNEIKMDSRYLQFPYFFNTFIGKKYITIIKRNSKIYVPYSR